MEIVPTKKDLRFNCKKETIDGVNFIVCSPELVDGDVRIPVGEIKFRELDDGTAELIDFQKMDPETMRRVKEYLEELGFRVRL